MIESRVHFRPLKSKSLFILFNREMNVPTYIVYLDDVAFKRERDRKVTTFNTGRIPTEGFFNVHLQSKESYNL